MTETKVCVAQSVSVNANQLLMCLLARKGHGGGGPSSVEESSSNLTWGRDLHFFQGNSSRDLT